MDFIPPHVTSMRFISSSLSLSFLFHPSLPAFSSHPSFLPSFLPFQKQQSIHCLNVAPSSSAITDSSTEQPRARGGRSLANERPSVRQVLNDDDEEWSSCAALPYPAHRVIERGGIRPRQEQAIKLSCPRHRGRIEGRSPSRLFR